MTRLAANVRAITLSDSGAGKSRASWSRETKVALLQLYKRYFVRRFIKESTAGEDPPNDDEGKQRTTKTSLDENWLTLFMEAENKGLVSSLNKRTREDAVNLAAT